MAAEAGTKMGNATYDPGLGAARRAAGGGGRATTAPGPMTYSAYGGMPTSGGGADFLRQLSDALAGGVNTANAQADQQAGLLGQQRDLLGANQQTQTGYINQDAATGNARIGLNREGLGIQSGALNRASALLPQQHAITMQGLADQLAQARYGAGMQRRSLSSAATTAGATVSTGARQGFADIMKQLGFSKKEINRATRSENLNYGERQAQLNDQRQQLTLAGRGLDLDAQELQTRTARALQQLGLSTSISVMDVTRAINDVNAGRYNNLAPYLGAIYQAGGIRPTG